jgi:hypothetical protein
VCVSQSPLVRMRTPRRSVMEAVAGVPLSLDEVARARGGIRRSRPARARVGRLHRRAPRASLVSGSGSGDGLHQRWPVPRARVLGGARHIRSSTSAHPSDGAAPPNRTRPSICTSPRSHASRSGPGSSCRQDQAYLRRSSPSSHARTRRALPRGGGPFVRRCSRRAARRDGGELHRQLRTIQASNRLEPND